MDLSLNSEGSRRRKGEQKIKRNPENRKIKGLTGSPQEMVPQGSQMGAERCQMGVRRDQIGAPKIDRKITFQRMPPIAGPASRPETNEREKAVDFSIFWVRPELAFLRFRENN